jgi:hypothetical protein
MSNLKSYSDAIHPLYFLTQYIDGLHHDIRAAVMVQRPADLDAACAQAALHEDATEELPCERVRYYQSRSVGRNSVVYPSKRLLLPSRVARTSGSGGPPRKNPREPRSVAALATAAAGDGGGGGARSPKAEG